MTETKPRFPRFRLATLLIVVTLCAIVVAPLSHYLRSLVQRPNIVETRLVQFSAEFQPAWTRQLRESLVDHGNQAMATNDRSDPSHFSEPRVHLRKVSGNTWELLAAGQSGRHDLHQLRQIVEQAVQALESQAEQADVETSVVSGSTMIRQAGLPERLLRRVYGRQE